MQLETIRLLYGYDAWINQRLLADSEKLPADQTRHQFGASFDTIHGTLAHILAAQIAWLSRWNGESPAALIPADDFDSLSAIRDRWQHHQELLDGFLAGLTPARLAAPLTYRDTQGKECTLPLWQQMLHVANHGTHHRSELAEMLTRAGSPPQPTDLIRYCLDRSSQQ